MFASTEILFFLAAGLLLCVLCWATDEAGKQWRERQEMKRCGRAGSHYGRE